MQHLNKKILPPFYIDTGHTFSYNESRKSQFERMFQYEPYRWRNFC